MRRGVSVPVLVLGAALVACASAAGEDAPAPAAPRLRLVHVLDGLRAVSPDNDLGKLELTEIHRLAKRAGIELRGKTHPLLVHRYERGRLFYLFYKTIEGALGPRPWVVQRIRKTVRDWKPGASEPEETVTYQVEAFKTIAGTLKHPDQHYGSFALREFDRREILKEYEIGFAVLPEAALPGGAGSGDVWPFRGDALYHRLQRYQEESALYDEVRFEGSVHWTLQVRLDAKGNHRIASPELGFDAPAQPPGPEQVAFRPDPATRHLVLVPGRGLEGLLVGTSTRADVERVLGVPLAFQPAGSGHVNLATPQEITVNVDAEGRVHTLITRRRFAGRTPEGIGLGARRWEVMRVYGPPGGAQADGPWWRYPGVVFYFDGFHRVERIVVFHDPTSARSKEGAARSKEGSAGSKEGPSK